MPELIDPIDPREQERERKEAKSRARLAEERDDQDLRWLMSSRQGRRMAARLLDKARVREATFNTNALQMAYNEGFRGFGNWMLGRILGVCPERYLELLKEQQDDERHTSGNGPNSK